MSEVVGRVYPVPVLRTRVRLAFGTVYYGIAEGRIGRSGVQLQPQSLVRQQTREVFERMLDRQVPLRVALTVSSLLLDLLLGSTAHIGLSLLD